MRFDVDFAIEVFLAAGAKVPYTLGIALLSLAIGAVFGLIIALLRFFKVPFFGVLFRVVVTIF